MTDEYAVDLVLAVLPFADVDRPAIGASLLQAEVSEHGFSCAVEYLNFDLAEAIGTGLYTRISESIPSESLVGEWFFADVVFGDQLPHEQLYVSRVLSGLAPEGLVREIREARSVRHAYVEECARKLLARRPRLVGFTSTFHQNCSCLAVARRLKDAANPPLVLFGGANCEGEMGLQMLRSFPWIDYICIREGDLALPQLLEGLLRRGDPRGVAGILRQGETSEPKPSDLVVNLDALPFPDYGDYMARLARVPPEHRVVPELLVETSRGCWWGARHHCTFCGLNGDTMAFRSKSPERAFREIAHLRQTYGVRKIDCVDNILDVRYLDTLFPRLRDSELDVELFYEVKSNLRQPQVAMLHAGGVRAIQPGIESFSNEVLRRMDKGCTGLQNIQLLRWCEEVGIKVAWNILAGFPGEDPSEYRKMADLVPLLIHLQPPSSCSPIRLDRFSPLFTKRDQVGLRGVRPTAAYYYVYPLGRQDLSRMAAFFDFDYPDGRAPASYLKELRREVDAWIVARGAPSGQAPRLDAEIGEDGAVTVTDTRPCATRPVHRLEGAAAGVFLACDSAQPGAALAARGNGGREAVGAILSQLRADNLVVEMEDRHLALAVLRNRTALGDQHAQPIPQEATPRAPLLRVG
jgi:ribosomal peptide maturation radical SAM protein 1